MEIGKEYGYREPPWSPGKPLQRVELVQLGPNKSSKVRIRLLEGEFNGLDMWVPKRRLEIPWDYADAYLQDEIRHDAVATASRKSKPTHDEIEAAWLVFWAFPDPDGINMEWRGSPSLGSMSMEDPEKACTELEIGVQDLLNTPTAFIDRHGTLHAPWAVTRRVALRVAARYSNAVLARVQKEESELQEKVIHGEYVKWDRNHPEVHIPGDRYVDELNKMTPAFNLARAWCGVESVAAFDEVLALRHEVDRLRELLFKVAKDLKNYGHSQVAARYRKAVVPEDS